MSLSKRAIAELFGTFWLVFGGCGSAVLAAAFPSLGIGFAGVALAFGLTVLTMAYAIGHISGCHLNPAVSAGLVAGKRFPVSELIPYIVAQVVGAVLAAGVLLVIARGKSGFSLSAGFASNGYGEHSPGGYTTTACFVAEVVLTMFFLLVIMGATDRRAPQGFAPIAIGFGLTLIHLTNRDSGYEPVGEPGTQHRAGTVGQRLGAAALALLGGSTPAWSNRGEERVQGPIRRRGSYASRPCRGALSRQSEKEGSITVLRLFSTS